MLASLLAAFCAAVGSASAEPAQSPVIHHDLVVTLDPANHRIKVRDRIRIPGALVSAPLTVSLNAELNVQAVSGGLRLLPVRSRVPGSDSGLDRDDHDPAALRLGEDPRPHATRDTGLELWWLDGDRQPPAKT